MVTVSRRPSTTTTGRAPRVAPLRPVRAPTGHDGDDRLDLGQRSFGPDYWRSLERLGGRPPAAATRVEPLRDGRDALAARMSLVRNAQDSLLASLYIVEPDVAGFAFIDELTAATRRGVDVTISLDSISQRVVDKQASPEARQQLHAKLAELEAAGATVAWAGGMKAFFQRPGAGNHYKAVIADHERAVVGGRNVGCHYVNHWTDFDALMEGPIVTDIATEAVELARSCRPYRTHGLRMRRTDNAAYQQRLDDLQAGIDAAKPKIARACAALPSYTLVAWDPKGDEGTFWPKTNNITLALKETIDRARHEVTISSNFVHAGVELRQALIKAAQRGVKVRIVTTGEEASEISLFPYLVSSAHYGDLVAAGCEIHETTMMEHGKMYLVDGAVGAFGSYNASRWSDERNAEALFFTKDPRMLTALDEALEDTIQNRAERYVPKPVDGWKGRLRSMAQAVLRIFT